MEKDIATRMRECTKYGTEDCCYRPDCPHVKDAAFEEETDKVSARYAARLERERRGIFL